MDEISTWQQRKDGVEEAFASLRLEGLYPSYDEIRLAREYIEGRMTLDEIRAQPIIGLTGDK